MNTYEIVKRAVEIAKERYPNGFNKKQLVECSKEVFGGRTGTPIDYRPIKNEDDIMNQRNAMYYVDGHYPASISDCEVVGINGDCGLGCPVFRRGDCEEHQNDMLKSLVEEEGLEGAIEILGEECPEMMECFWGHIENSK